MEDDLFRDSTQTVLTCNEKNYLNSIISGDLNETVSYFNDSSEEETELYINTLLNRLTSLDKDIWYSIEVIQNNAYGSLKELCGLLNSLPDRDVEFKNLVKPLKRVENLTVSIERKYEKTYKLRQLKNLKTLLTSNQKVLSLIYNWDDNIKSVQTIISSYLSHKDSFNTSKKDSINMLRSDARMKRYLILGSDGFCMDDLDKLKQILSQLKGDYDTCLNNMINTNIPQTLGIIMDKYYIILEDLTVDIIHFILLSYNFYNLVKADASVLEKDRVNEEGNSYNGIHKVKEYNANVVIEQMKIDRGSEENVKKQLERYVKYYIFEETNNNINILNRHLKNKLEDMFMSYLRLICSEESFDLFTRNKEELDFINNLVKLNRILNSFLKYLFLVFMSFKSSFYFIISYYLKANQDCIDVYESENSNNKVYKLSSREGVEGTLEAQLEEYFRKLIMNILSSCILNSNVFYVVSTLSEEDLYLCLNAIFTTFEDIFTKYNQYLKHLNIDKHLEYMNFIPFDILDKYVNIVHDKAEMFITKYQQNYNELLDSVNGFKHMLNQLNKLQLNIESNGKDGNLGIDARLLDNDARGDGKEGGNVLNWLYIYCLLNYAKVEFDVICEEVTGYVTGYFDVLKPKVETNPINTTFEKKCRDYMLELLEVQRSLGTAVEALLSLSNRYLMNKIDKNINNCLKEQHDWKLSSKMLEPFRDVVFGHRDSSELVREFEMSSLVYSVSQNMARFISRNTSYLIQFFYQSIVSSTSPNGSGHGPLQSDNDNVNMYVELIGEYYINLLSVYYENGDTFGVLQKSMEMFIDSEFENLANLKSKLSPSSCRKNVDYLIKIAKLLKINTSDSLSMLIS